MSEVTYRIAQVDDVAAVFEYESRKHFDPNIDEIENQIFIWNSNFRKEALEHYFKTGWSFVAVNPQQQIAGFFMGQALLFIDKQTQSLWVEYVSADTDAVYTELVDIAYRLSREKHFQRVLFADEVAQHNLTKPFPFQKWDRTTTWLKTTK